MHRRQSRRRPQPCHRNPGVLTAAPPESDAKTRTAPLLIRPDLADGWDSFAVLCLHRLSITGPSLTTDWGPKPGGM